MSTNNWVLAKVEEKLLIVGQFPCKWRRWHGVGKRRPCGRLQSFEPGSDFSETLESTTLIYCRDAPLVLCYIGQQAVLVRSFVGSGPLSSARMCSLGHVGPDLA